MGPSGDALPSETARSIARDAHRLYAATLRELPNAGVLASGLAASLSRHRALESYWAAKAAVLGPETAEGRQAEESATKHGTRAERLSVTLLEVAARMSKRAAAEAPSFSATLTAVADDDASSWDAPEASNEKKGE